MALSLIALGGAWVLRRQGSPNLGALYAVMVLWGMGDVLHFWGMETAFYALLLLTTVICALKRRPGG